jgi:hypothetical protein
MLNLMKFSFNKQSSQRGEAVVEFAIVALLLFTLLFGIIEFGRLFYVFNSVQEVTRRAAREAVVRWAVNDTVEENKIKNLALFGGDNLPAGAEITRERINIEYLNANGELVTSESDPPISENSSDNIEACLEGSAACIAFVRVSITGATYAPMVSLFPYFNIPIPASTVTMPAESMGYSG